jgi:hypothetical protein
VNAKKSLNKSRKAYKAHAVKKINNRIKKAENTVIYFVKRLFKILYILYTTLNLNITAYSSYIKF